MYLHYLRQRIPSILQRTKVNKVVSRTVFKANHRFCLERNVSCKVVDEYPLTKTEALSYVEDVLGISDCQKLLAEDPLSFVNLLTVQTKARIPFTNIVLFTREGVYHPNTDETKELMLSRQGGNCWIFNIFTEAVLRRLGLQTYLAPSSYFRFGGARMIARSAIIIKDLVQPGTLHLVDPGTSMPMFNAVPLDIKESSPAHVECGFRFKYFKAGIGVIQVCRMTSLAELGNLRSPVSFHFSDGHFWSVIFTYNINESRSPSYFAQVSKNVRADPAGQFIHNELQLVGFPGGEMVNINSEKGIITDKSGNTTCIPITNSDTLVELVKKFFPCVSIAALNSSLEYFRKSPK